MVECDVVLFLVRNVMWYEVYVECDSVRSVWNVIQCSLCGMCCGAVCVECDLVGCDDVVLTCTERRGHQPEPVEADTEERNREE